MYSDADIELDTMTIMPLGGGQEVGRSCIYLQYRGRTVMLDCGTHPGREGHDAIPLFDLCDPKEIDLLLVTHFHIDHCAALPYFTEQTDFKGKILMTHATKAVMKLLLSDNIKLQVGKSKSLYTEMELQSCIDKIDVLDYHQTIEHRGIKITATAAGHVLGAAMFTIDIDGIRVLYTGDYSMEVDRHLIPASVPPGAQAADVLIVESTFGVQTLAPKEEREAKFTKVVEDIVTRGGSCLIPVFALGRAQELLLILDEHWQENPELTTVPIYYASKLATKALRVYQTFINTMNDHIRTRMDFCNPFHFDHITNMPSVEGIGYGPCVVMASPGFMQSGVSRQLFEAWCDDDRNGVIVAGYTVEGTLVHDLLSAPQKITCLDNRIKDRRCQIEHISFSAHVDYTQNSSFIKGVVPDNIVLVHGEKTGMKRLKDELDREIRRSWPSAHKPNVAMPENGVVVKLPFNKPLVAEVVGAAASALLGEMDTARGRGKAAGGAGSGPVRAAHIPKDALLVTENFDSKVVSTRDLAAHTSCRQGKIKQRLLVPVPAGLPLGGGIGFIATPAAAANSPSTALLHLLAPYLEEVFDKVSLRSGSNSSSDGGGDGAGDGYGDGDGLLLGLWVQEIVCLSVSDTGALGTAGSSSLSLVVEWVSSPLADMVADSVVGVVLQTLSAPSMLRMTMGMGLGGSGPIGGSSKAAPAAAASGRLPGSRRRRRDPQGGSSIPPAGGAGAGAGESGAKSSAATGQASASVSVGIVSSEGMESEEPAAAAAAAAGLLPSSGSAEAEAVVGAEAMEACGAVQVKSEFGMGPTEEPSGGAIKVDNVIEESLAQVQEEILKKMRTGDLDPAAALPERAKWLASTAASGAASGAATATLGVPGEVKLQRLAAAILAEDFASNFSSVILNADHTKLIFRSISQDEGGGGGGGGGGVETGGTAGDALAGEQHGYSSEAYCYIVWGDESTAWDVPAATVEADNSIREGIDSRAQGGRHEAVVQSEDSAFRSIVIAAIQSVL